MGERIAQERRRACGTRNRRDKTVAAARHIGHIARARSPLPKRLAQRQDMKAKAALIYHKVRPHFCDQLLLADHFGRAFDEGDENVEGTAADPNRDAVLFEDPLRGGQTKWTKTEHVLRNRPSRLRIHDIHFLSPGYAPRSDLIFNDGGTTSVPLNEAVDWNWCLTVACRPSWFESTTHHSRRNRPSRDWHLATQSSFR